MENVWLNPTYAKSTAPFAIFADRDGTLIEHVDYVSNPDQVQLLPGVKDTVQKLIKARIPFHILTNQSGVGRGYFPIEQVHACQERLFELLQIEPTDLAGWCIAPEAPETKGGYRKPSSKYLDQACEHMELSASQCHVIGDTLVDLETAWNSGAVAWAVSCGKPELPQRIRAGEVHGPYTLCDDLPQAIQMIEDVR